MYIANHYVSINKMMYTAGESIPSDEIDHEKLEWLLKSGAVSAAPDFDEKVIEAEEVEDTEAETEEETEEVDEIEDDMPEIDVMAGIVEKDDAPVKKTRKKTERGSSK
ncbi:MAG: hypothetical protein Q4B26_03165 [Eubacteriales bacterium]|nr:hypothetical protein [Eubacteriales bacterium]